jgi:hypothetical protein
MKPKVESRLAESIALRASEESAGEVPTPNKSKEAPVSSPKLDDVSSVFIRRDEKLRALSGIKLIEDWAAEKGPQHSFRVSGFAAWVRVSGTMMIDLAGVAPDFVDHWLLKFSTKGGNVRGQVKMLAGQRGSIRRLLYRAQALAAAQGGAVGSIVETHFFHGSLEFIQRVLRHRPDILRAYLKEDSEWINSKNYNAAEAERIRAVYRWQSNIEGLAQIATKEKDVIEP